MKKVDIKDFIYFWEKYCDEGKYPDKIYFNCFKKNLWKIGDLDEVFEWKNGTKLSKRKQKILQRVYDKLDEINSFRNLKSPSEKEFRNFYNNICSSVISSGLVWRIFLIHLTHPEKYPMIDKFTYIAYEFLKKNNLLKKGETDKMLLKYQLEVYFPFRIFFLNLNTNIHNQRKTDKALMAFGQFLTNPRLK